jgi:hypothetical protein
MENIMNDTNPERPDDRDPATNERREEQMNAGISMKEMLEKGTIVLVRETE